MNMSMSAILIKIGIHLPMVGGALLIGIASEAAATQLHLILPTGSGKPTKVIILFDGKDEQEIPEPWKYELPPIPDNQWQTTFHLVISSDTTQSTDKPTDIEIPIRHTRYHAQQNPIMRLPVYIRTAPEKLNDDFAKRFEQLPTTEDKIVIFYFATQYAFNRIDDHKGPLARRILFSALERAANYTDKFRYAPVGEKAIKEVDDMLADQNAEERVKAEKKFNNWITPDKGTRGVAKLDQLRYEAWTDLALYADRNALKTNKDRCILTSHYVPQFDQKSANDQQIITRLLGYKPDDWATLRNFMTSDVCKAG